MALETAEVVVRRFCRECITVGDTPGKPGEVDVVVKANRGSEIIEADRNAVRRELLDELIPLLERTGRNVAILDVLRAKYGAPKEGG